MSVILFENFILHALVECMRKRFFYTPQPVRQPTVGLNRGAALRGILLSHVTFGPLSYNAPYVG